MRILILRLRTLKAPCVALTHCTFGTEGDEHPVAVTSRSVETARAWKNVVTFFRAVFCRLNRYAPFPVVVVEKRCFPLTSSRTVASTVPAAFGTPLPAPYGVHSDVQRTAPDGGVKTPLTVKLAESSCAPNGERPGEPCGVSDGARQTVSFADPRPASAADVGLT